MLRRFGRWGGASILALGLAGSGSAATNPKDFDQRLTVLEQAQAAAANGSGQSQAQLVIQLQQMQAELRQLRGMVEESSNQVQQLQKRQREFYMDLDGRLSALEGGSHGQSAAAVDSAPAAAAPAQPGTTSVDVEPGRDGVPAEQPAPTNASPVERSVAAVEAGGLAAPPAGGPQPADVAVAKIPAEPTGAVAAGGEQAAYRAASELLRTGRYEDAIAGFQGQLKQYPGGSLAANAQYWIGEAYYVTRQFDRSLTEFQRVVSQYPQSPKAADAMLKVGYIQYERREFAAARQTLTKLKVTWPASPASRLADNRLARMKEEGV